MMTDMLLLLHFLEITSASQIIVPVIQYTSAKYPAEKATKTRYEFGIMKCRIMLPQIALTPLTPIYIKGSDSIDIKDDDSSKSLLPLSMLKLISFYRYLAIFGQGCQSN